MPTSDNIQSSQLSDWLNDYLVAELRQALQTTVFTSTLRIAPRRVNQIAQEAVMAFQRYLVEYDEVLARQDGRNWAREGLSIQAVLALVWTFHRICGESNHSPISRLPISEHYTKPLLESYMLEREALLLQEQERIRAAFERARRDQG